MSLRPLPTPILSRRQALNVGSMEGKPHRMLTLDFRLVSLAAKERPSAMKACHIVVDVEGYGWTVFTTISEPPRTFLRSHAEMPNSYN